MSKTLAGITFYTLKEIAEALVCNVVTVRGWVKDGKLKARKIAGNEYVVLEKDLAAFMQGETAQPKSAPLS